MQDLISYKNIIYEKGKYIHLSKCYNNNKYLFEDSIKKISGFYRIKAVCIAEINVSCTLVFPSLGAPAMTTMPSFPSSLRITHPWNVMWAKLAPQLMLSQYISPSRLLKWSIWKMSTLYKVVWCYIRGVKKQNRKVIYE